MTIYKILRQVDDADRLSVKRIVKRRIVLINVFIVGLLKSLSLDFCDKKWTNPHLQFGFHIY